QSMTDAPEGVATKNLEIAHGLREIAHWLEAHPDLPDASTGSVYFFTYGKEARAALTAVADALGDRAEESVAGSEVRIIASFGSARVHACASLKDLGGQAPV